MLSCLPQRKNSRAAALRGLIPGLVWCAPRTCSSRLHARLQGSLWLRLNCLAASSSVEPCAAALRGLLSGVLCAPATLGSASVCSAAAAHRPQLTGPGSQAPAPRPYVWQRRLTASSSPAPAHRLRLTGSGSQAPPSCSAALGSGLSVPLLRAVQSVMMAVIRGLLPGVLRSAPRPRDSRLRAFTSGGGGVSRPGPGSSAGVHPLAFRSSRSAKFRFGIPPRTPSASSPCAPRDRRLPVSPRLLGGPPVNLHRAALCAGYVHDLVVRRLLEVDRATLDVGRVLELLARRLHVLAALLGAGVRHLAYQRVHRGLPHPRAVGHVDEVPQLRVARAARVDASYRRGRAVASSLRRVDVAVVGRLLPVSRAFPQAPSRTQRSRRCGSLCACLFAAAHPRHLRAGYLLPLAHSLLLLTFSKMLKALQRWSRTLYSASPAVAQNTQRSALALLPCASKTTRSL